MSIICIKYRKSLKWWSRRSVGNMRQPEKSQDWCHVCSIFYLHQIQEVFEVAIICIKYGNSLKWLHNIDPSPIHDEAENGSVWSGYGFTIEMLYLFAYLKVGVLMVKLSCAGHSSTRKQLSPLEENFGQTRTSCFFSREKQRPFACWLDNRCGTI